MKRRVIFSSSRSYSSCTRTIITLQNTLCTAYILVNKLLLVLVTVPLHLSYEGYAMCTIYNGWIWSQMLSIECIHTEVSY